MISIRLGGHPVVCGGRIWAVFADKTVSKSLTKGELYDPLFDAFFYDSIIIKMLGLQVLFYGSCQR